MSEQVESTSPTFAIPERQSKINTILKSMTGKGKRERKDSSKEERVYCICRRSDCARFMICCDHCDEWFHGDCIRIKEEAARKIKRFFCASCRGQDSSLVIKYKRQYRFHDADDDRQQANITTSKPEKHRDRSPLRKKDRVETPRSGQKESGKRKPGRPRKDSYRVEPVDVKPINARQCMGPSCSHQARLSSKYCSDECGIELARRRVLHFLPSRLKDWKESPSRADLRDKEELEKIKEEMNSIKSQLNDLEKKYERLDQLVQRTKSEKVVESEEDNGDEEESEGNNESSNTYCVTCGIEVSQKTAIRHMERCYFKYEGRLTYETPVPTEIQGRPLFCDHINSQSKLYCKRLKVLCPDHYKEPKVGDDEVCGYPLVDDVKETGQICRIAKKKCNKHCKWERLRRAELDMKRYLLLSQVEEVYLKERSVAATQASRAGVLSLLLHRTVVH